MFNLITTPFPSESASLPCSLGPSRPSLSTRAVASTPGATFSFEGSSTSPSSQLAFPLLLFNIERFFKLSFLLFRFRSTVIMSQKRKAADLAASEAKKTKPNASITSFFGPPKAASTSTASSKKAGIPSVTSKDVETTPEAETTSTRVPFDIEAWAKKLNPEQKELLGLEISTLHESWFKELKDDLLTKEFLDLKRFLKKEHEGKKQIFPPAEDVYSWFVFPFYTFHTFPPQPQFDPLNLYFTDANSLIQPGPVTPPSTPSKPS